jgi:superfamily II DNA helicase RecQ
MSTNLINKPSIQFINDNIDDVTKNLCSDYWEYEKGKFKTLVEQLVKKYSLTNAEQLHNMVEVNSIFIFQAICSESSCKQIFESNVNTRSKFQEHRRKKCKRCSKDFNQEIIIEILERIIESTKEIEKLRNEKDKLLASKTANHFSFSLIKSIDKSSTNKADYWNTFILPTEIFLIPGVKYFSEAIIQADGSINLTFSTEENVKNLSEGDTDKALQLRINAIDNELNRLIFDKENDEDYLERFKESFKNDPCAETLIVCPRELSLKC